MSHTRVTRSKLKPRVNIVINHSVAYIVGCCGGRERGREREGERERERERGIEREREREREKMIEREKKK